MKTLKIVLPVILFFVIISLTISENNFLSASNVSTSSVIKVSVRNPVDSTPISGARVVVYGPGGTNCCGVTDQNGMFGCITSNGNVSVCASYSGKYQSKTQNCWDYSCFFDMFPNSNGSCVCDQQHPIIH